MCNAHTSVGTVWFAGDITFTLPNLENPHIVQGYSSITNPCFWTLNFMICVHRLTVLYDEVRHNVHNWNLWGKPCMICLWVYWHTINSYFLHKGTPSLVLVLLSLTFYFNFRCSRGPDTLNCTRLVIKRLTNMRWFSLAWIMFVWQCCLNVVTLWLCWFLSACVFLCLSLLVPVLGLDAL